MWIEFWNLINEDLPLLKIAFTETVNVEYMRLND